MYPYDFPLVDGTYFCTCFRILFDCCGNSGTLVGSITVSVGIFVVLGVSVGIFVVLGVGVDRLLPFVRRSPWVIKYRIKIISAFIHHRWISMCVGHVDKIIHFSICFVGFLDSCVFDG